MDAIRIKSSKIEGRLCIPSSKSHTMRALLFAFLAKGTSKVSNLLDSPDTRCMLTAIELMGAMVVSREDSVEITGVGGKPKIASDVINAGNSGLILRFMTAISALIDGYTLITGDQSIRHQRDIDPVLRALKTGGAFAKSTKEDGHAPVIIKGPITPGEYHIDGSDSQFVSSMLIALAFLDDPSRLYVDHPGEKPWVDLTLYWLDKFGIDVKREEYDLFYLDGNAKIEAFSICIPGDFSTAAFSIAAAIVSCGHLTIEGLDKEDPQGDKLFIDVLKEMGAELFWKEDDLVISGGYIAGGEVDINSHIDSLPILAVLGCYAKAPLRICGAAIARGKECDRISVIASELRKMGANIIEHFDGLEIFPSCLHGASVNSHDDHRIAMALSVAALGATGDTHIEGISCTSKTFPNFIKAFSGLGVEIEECNFARI